MKIILRSRAVQSFILVNRKVKNVGFENYFRCVSDL